MASLHILQQEFSTWQNYNYLVYEHVEKKGVMIDASQGSEQMLVEAGNLGIHLKKILLTHAHFDHIHAVEKILELLPDIKIGIHENEAGALRWVGDQLEIVSDGQVIPLGQASIQVFHTPGHTRGSVCYLSDECIFTGDTVFIGGHGRTDLAGGDFEELKKSFIKLQRLPDSLVLYPGHAYAVEKCSTLGKEKNNLSTYFKT